MQNLFDLSGRTAVITGGASGLGIGIAEGFSEFGAKVALIDFSQTVSETADRIQKATGKPVFGVQGDLSRQEELSHAFSDSVSLLGGGLTIIVNCAGISHLCVSEEFPLDKWDSVMAINLKAVFSLSQLAAKIMLRQGYGKIINIASMLSFFGGKNSPAYSASKGAIMQLTKSMSNDWAAEGINVNALAPGYMMTPLNRVIDSERKKAIDLRIPKGRWGTPDDIKGAAIFLASAASDYLCGAIIPVDGGYLVL